MGLNKEKTLIIPTLDVATILLYMNGLNLSSSDLNLQRCFKMNDNEDMYILDEPLLDDAKVI